MSVSDDKLNKRKLMKKKNMNDLKLLKRTLKKLVEIARMYMRVYETTCYRCKSNPSLVDRLLPMQKP